jgi:hypothetical protein
MPERLRALPGVPTGDMAIGVPLGVPGAAAAFIGEAATGESATSAATSAAAAAGEAASRVAAHSGVRAALVGELGATRVELGAAEEKKGLLSFCGAASVAKLAKGRPNNGVLKLRKRTGETMP